jgi:ParB-like chromosome segregation protein Spo0J
MNINEMPISNIEWVDVEKLSANDYNPNVVFSDEMRLLRFSLKKHGWIQPILCTQDYVIIDGFHRATIAKTHADVTCGGKVPCCIMQMSEAERMLLTIRINRAKGSHIAVKMADIIHALVNDFGMPIETICREIGADKAEVELLLMDDVFARKNINEETQYSKAWYPKRVAD